MTDYPILTELLDLPNVKVVHYQLVGHHRLNVFVESTLPVAVCPMCKQINVAVHDVGEPQMLRDLSIWKRQCWLHYAPRRFKCTSCQNTFVERLLWRDAGLAYTQRYEQFIYEHVQHDTIAQVARDEGLSEDIVQSLFERRAKNNHRARLSRRKSAVLG